MSRNLKPKSHRAELMATIRILNDEIQKAKEVREAAKAEMATMRARFMDFLVDEKLNSRESNTA